MSLTSYPITVSSSRAMLGNCSATRRLLAPKLTAVTGISRHTVCCCSSAGIGIHRGKLLPRHNHQLHQQSPCHTTTNPLHSPTTTTHSGSSSGSSRGSSVVAHGRRNKGSYLFQVEGEAQDVKSQTFQTEQSMLARYNSLLKESNLMNDLKSRSRFERPRDKIKRQRQERIEIRKWQHKQAQGFVPETLESAGGPDQKLEEPFFEYFEMRASWDKVMDYDDPALAFQEASDSQQQQQEEYGYYAFNPNGVIDIDMGGYLPGSAGGAAGSQVTEYGGYLAGHPAAWNAAGYGTAAGFDGSYSAPAAAGAGAAPFSDAGGYVNSNAAATGAAAAADDAGGFLDMQQLAAPLQGHYQQAWQQQQQQQYYDAVDLADPATAAGAVWDSSTTGQYMDPALGTAASTLQQQQFQQVWVDPEAQQQQQTGQQVWPVPLSQEQQAWADPSNAYAQLQQQQAFEQVWGNMYVANQGQEQPQQQQQQQQFWMPQPSSAEPVPAMAASISDAFLAAADQLLTAAGPAGNSADALGQAHAAAAAAPEPVTGSVGGELAMAAGGYGDMAAATAAAAGQQQLALAEEMAAAPATAAQLPSSEALAVESNWVQVVNAAATGLEFTASAVVPAADVAAVPAATVSLASEETSAAAAAAGPRSVPSWLVVEAAPAAEVGLAWILEPQELQTDLTASQQQQQEEEEPVSDEEMQPQPTADSAMAAAAVYQTAAGPAVEEGSSSAVKASQQQQQQQRMEIVEAARDVTVFAQTNTADVSDSRAAADATPVAAGNQPEALSQPPARSRQQNRQQGKAKQSGKPPVSAAADGRRSPVAAANGARRGRATQGRLQRQQQQQQEAQRHQQQGQKEVATVAGGGVTPAAITAGPAAAGGPSFNAAAAAAAVRDAQAALAASMGTTQALHHFLTAQASGSSNDGTTMGVSWDNSSPDRSDSPGRFRRIQRRGRATSRGDSGSGSGGGDGSSSEAARGADGSGSSGMYRRSNYNGTGLQGPIVLDAVNSNNGASSDGSSSSHKHQTRQQQDSAAAV